MKIKLTDTHRDLLIWLVQETRKGNLAQEFQIKWNPWGWGGNVRDGELARQDYTGSSNLPRFKKTTLEFLASEGFLISAPEFSETAVETSPQFMTTREALSGQLDKHWERTELSRLCTLTRQAYETVDRMLESKPDRCLRVFLCHSSEDKAMVYDLYHRLSAETSIDPWLDQEKILGGQNWDFEINKAIRNSDAVIVCLSRNSVNKEGYVQKEIAKALNIATEKPEDIIFIIPLKLEECQIPQRLSRWQWVNLFEDGGYKQLMRSLQKRANSLGI